MQTYGYVGVSSTDQNEMRQMVALKEIGISEKNIFVDKQSEKDFERTNYKLLLEKLRCGEVCTDFRISGDCKTEERFDY